MQDAEYQKNLNGLMKSLRRFVVTILVADENMKVVAGDWPSLRAIVLDFSSKEATHQRHTS